MIKVSEELLETLKNNLDKGVTVFLYSCGKEAVLHGIVRIWPHGVFYIEADDGETKLPIVDSGAISQFVVVKGILSNEGRILYHHPDLYR